MWNPIVVADLVALAQQHPNPDTINKVITRLQATGPALDGQEQGGRNPIKAFNDLYLDITRQVGDGLPQNGGQDFVDAAFMEQLDVEFAKLYFEAVDGSIAGNQVPEAWEYLFKEEHNGDRYANIEGALLGVNAHINHDLTNALLNAEIVLPNPADLSDRKADFDRINDIFRNQIGPIVARLIGELQNTWKKWFWQLLDFAFGGLDEKIILKMIEAARNRAWNRAAAEWSGRPELIPEEDEFSVFLAEVIAGSPLFRDLDSEQQQMLGQASAQALTTGTVDLAILSPASGSVRFTDRFGDGLEGDLVDQAELRKILTTDRFRHSLEQANVGDSERLQALVENYHRLRQAPDDLGWDQPLE